MQYEWPGMVEQSKTARVNHRHRMISPEASGNRRCILHGVHFIPAHRDIYASVRPDGSADTYCLRLHHGLQYPRYSLNDSSETLCPVTQRSSAHAQRVTLKDEAEPESRGVNSHINKKKVPYFTTFSTVPSALRNGSPCALQRCGEAPSPALIGPNISHCDLEYQDSI